jgi:metallothiol transferase
MQSVQKIYAVWTYVSNAEKSMTFYKKVLGVKPRLQDDGWIEFDTGETVFAILERPKEKGVLKPAKTRIMFQVTDITEKENELKALGVKIIGKMKESYGVILTFEDPDQNWLEFYEPRGKEGV